MSSKKEVVIDYKKLFLSKPEGLFEQFSLIIVLACSFALYFSPLVFSELKPSSAILIVIFPTLSTGWALFSIVRLLRYKDKYTK